MIPKTGTLNNFWMKCKEIETQKTWNVFINEYKNSFRYSAKENIMKSDERQDGLILACMQIK